MRKGDASVSSYVVMILLIVATVLFSALGAVDYLSERSRRQAELRSDVQLMADQLSASLALPVWNFDQSQIRKILESAVQDPEVQGVELTLDLSANGDAKSRTYSRARDAAGNLVRNADFSKANTLEEQRMIFASDDTDHQSKVGRVSVYVTQAFMQQDLREQLTKKIATFLAFGLVLTAILYLILWRIVLKPLTIIEQYAREVSSGAESPDISHGARFRGELDHLRLSIEKMVNLLAVRYDALHKNQAMLSGILNSVPQSISWKNIDGAYLGCNEPFAIAAGLSKPELVVGKTDFDLPWPKEESEKYRADDRFVMDAKIPKRRFVEPLQLFNGTRVWMETTKLPLLDEGSRVYGVLGVFDDISVRIAAEQLIESQLRFEELVAGISSLLVAARPDNLNATLAQALHQIGEKLDADRIVLGQTDDATGDMMARAHYRACEPPFPDRLIISERYPALWRKLLSGQVSHIRDVTALGDEESVDRKHFQEIGIKSQVTAPIFVDGRLKFILAVASIHAQREWHEEAIARIQVLAEVLATTVMRCAAEEESRAYSKRIHALASELLRADERQRRELAAILHDEVGQNLFAATTQLVSIRNRTESARADIEKTLTLLGQISRDTRELTFELCPPVLYQLGLAPALQRLVEQFTDRYSIACTLSGTSAGPDDLNVRGLAYHCVRELLANTAKHAHAHHVSVQLIEAGNDLIIQVNDDGVGFDPQKLGRDRGGFGLFQLRERIGILDGRLIVTSSPGNGCQAEFHLPLKLVMREQSS